MRGAIHRCIRWFAVGTLALGVGCSSDDDTPDGNDGDAGASRTTVPDPDRACAEPPPSEVGIGRPSGDEITEEVTTRCAWVEVPAGVETLTVTLDAPTADLSLTVGYGYLFTVQLGDGEVWKGEQTEQGASVVIDAPRPGPYVTEVESARPGAAGPYTLAVKTDPPMQIEPTGGALPEPDDCAAPAVELTPGEPAMGEVRARAGTPLARAYFCLETLGDFSVDVAASDEPLDVVVRDASGRVVGADRSGDGPTRTATVSGVPSGAYYIEVVAGAPGAASSFDIEAG